MRVDDEPRLVQPLDGLHVQLGRLLDGAEQQRRLRHQLLRGGGPVDVERGRRRRHPQQVLEVGQLEGAVAVARRRRVHHLAQQARGALRGRGLVRLRRGEAVARRRQVAAHERAHGLRVRRALEARKVEALQVGHGAAQQLGARHVQVHALVERARRVGGRAHVRHLLERAADLGAAAAAGLQHVRAARAQGGQLGLVLGEAAAVKVHVLGQARHVRHVRPDEAHGVVVAEAPHAGGGAGQHAAGDARQPRERLRVGAEERADDGRRDGVVVEPGQALQRLQRRARRRAGVLGQVRVEGEHGVQRRGHGLGVRGERALGGGAQLRGVVAAVRRHVAQAHELGRVEGVLLGAAQRRVGGARPELALRALHLRRAARLHGRHGRLQLADALARRERHLLQLRLLHGGRARHLQRQVPRLDQRPLVGLRAQPPEHLHGRRHGRRQRGLQRRHALRLAQRRGALLALPRQRLQEAQLRVLHGGAEHPRGARRLLRRVRVRQRRRHRVGVREEEARDRRVVRERVDQRAERLPGAHQRAGVGGQQLAVARHQPPQRRDHRAGHGRGRDVREQVHRRAQRGKVAEQRAQPHVEVVLLGGALLRRLHQRAQLGVAPREPRARLLAQHVAAHAADVPQQVLHRAHARLLVRGGRQGGVHGVEARQVGVGRGALGRALVDLVHVARERVQLAPLQMPVRLRLGQQREPGPEALVRAHVLARLQQLRQQRAVVGGGRRVQRAQPLLGGRQRVDEAAQARHRGVGHAEALRAVAVHQHGLGAVLRAAQKVLADGVADHQRQLARQLGRALLDVARVRLGRAGRRPRVHGVKVGVRGLERRLERAHVARALERALRLAGLARPRARKQAPRARHHRLVVDAAGVPRRGLHEARRELRVGAPGLERVQRPVHGLVRGPRDARRHQRQIGRASCRERV